MVPDRQALIAHCRQAQQARRADYVRELTSLDEAASRETKSSAGDKYETAREMIAQGRNLVLRNLAVTDANLETLERMAAAPASGAITLGSLVETSLGWYLVGVNLGEIAWQGAVIRTLTLGSPLGLALRGRSEGYRVPWRGQDLVILRILA